ncbi:IS200/IS605 family transposase [Nitrososphaera sp.]|uniref:IS200/IS605 family transposase n=1 Tax=Nitrososphaera sp. TaxID=1971748 RepID=UPI00307FB4DB
MGRASSAVYNINYHIVWCPKYRKAILTEKVKEFLEDQLRTIAETKGYKILELRVMPDHIHLFIEANPFDSPINIVKIFKGITGLRMFKKFPELEKQLWRGVLWSPSYYIGTAGHVSAEVIERYIREQERHSLSSG